MTRPSGILNARPLRYSVPVGSQLELVVANPPLTEQMSLAFSIAKVENDLTDFAMGWGGPISTAKGGSSLALPTTEALSPGLYLLTRLVLSSAPETAVDLAGGDDGIYLFEVRNPTVPPRTQEELEAEYARILAAREQHFTSGFGGAPGTPGMREYLGLVFAKDCLVPGRLRLGQYEVIPFEGLPCMDELSVVQSFLTQYGFGQITNAEDTLRRAQGGQPTIVVRFPRVIASSVDDAGRCIEEEARLLGDVLSINRISYAEIFGSVLKDLSTGEVFYRVYTPTYRGNLISGTFFREDPIIIARLSKARTDCRLQTYLSLYRDALKEERVEVAFLRLWSLMEASARDKGYLKKPRYDWQGNVVKDRKGRAQLIEDRAEQLVFELIRQSLSGPGVAENSWASSLQQGRLGELVAIWYRRRNCIGHQGGCFPDDPRHCDRSNPKYVNCKRAYDEIKAAGGERTTVGYYWVLREIVGQLLAVECR